MQDLGYVIGKNHQVDGLRRRRSRGTRSPANPLRLSQNDASIKEQSMGDLSAGVLEDGAVEITFIDDEGRRKRTELPLGLVQKLSAQLQALLGAAAVRAT